MGELIIFLAFANVMVMLGRWSSNKNS